MAPPLHLLAAILADVDALWWPYRVTLRSSPAFAAVLERRELYAGRGVELTMGGSAAERKSGERELAELAEHGWIRLYRSGGRRSGVALTTAGDDYIRSLCPSCRVDEAWPALRRVFKTEQLFGDDTNCGFVLEHHVLNPRPSDDDQKLLQDFEDDCTPLIARGLLESFSDTVGRLGYRTTKLGREALKGRKPKPPAEIPEYNPALGQEFIELFLQAMRNRETWQPSTPSQCVIPLSAGNWPELPKKKAAKRRPTPRSRGPKKTHSRAAAGRNSTQRAEGTRCITSPPTNQRPKKSTK